MATTSLSGLSTGIDTAALVQQLMEVEKRRYNIMQNKLTAYNEKKTAVSELQSKLSSYKSSLNKISDTGKLKSFDVTTSDEDVVTASASASASEGNHSLTIKQLATSDRWVHGGFTYATSYVGEGKFIYSYNNVERVITIGDDVTLQDLANKINNDSDNPGVTASLLRYDNGDGKQWHLVLAGQDSGGDYQITVNTSTTEVHTAATAFQCRGDNADKTTKLKDLEGFSGTIESGSTADKIRVTGKTHNGTDVNYSFDVTRYTTIEDLVREMETAFGDTAAVTYKDGLLKVTDKSSGVSQMSVTLAFEAGTGSSASLTLPTISQTTEGGQFGDQLVASLAADTFTPTQSAQDSLFKVDDYPPGANNWISRSSNTITDVVDGVTLNLQSATGNDIDGYDTVEINLTRNTEQLKENLNKMIEAYNTVIMYIDEKTTYDTENKKMGVLSSDYTLSSIQSLITTPFISVAGGFTSNDDVVRPQDIGLEIGADGMLSLDEAAFDDAIADNYQAVLELIGAQKAGVSAGDDAAYISFNTASKNTVAGSYDVEVIVDEFGTITSARIKTTSENWSQARNMTINGSTLVGNSTRSSSNNQPLYPECDLTLTVDTSQTGTLTTTINIKQGFAGVEYDTVSQTIQASTGRVPIAKKTVESQISDIEKRMDNETDRLTKYETRLKEKYARMERLMSQLQQQLSSINSLSS